MRHGFIVAGLHLNQRWMKMIWKRPSSPPAKKFKVQPSTRQNMATILFWDSKGVLLVDILLLCQTINAVRTINAARYSETLNKLREAVRRKRPGLLRRRFSTWQRHLPYSKHYETLASNVRLGSFTHPLHGPDLAPSEFHLFGPLKRHLSEKTYDNDVNFISEVSSGLKSLDVNF